LLENLQQEEELIKASQHPILLSLQENVDIAKELRLNQARQKFQQLGTYLDRLNYERQQRIWDTWKDAKIRLQTEMIVDCQIRLNRAPFEFLISDDTTNLQAIFHLTPTPTPAYLPKILSMNPSELKEFAPGSSTAGAGERGKPTTEARMDEGGARAIAGGHQYGQEGPPPKGKRMIVDSQPEAGAMHSNKQRKTAAVQHHRISSSKGHDGGLEDSRLEGSQQGEQPHIDAVAFRNSLDIIHRLDRQRVRNHAVWQLSHPDIRHDLKLIHRHRTRSLHNLHRNQRNPFPSTLSLPLP